MQMFKCFNSFIRAITFGGSDLIFFIVESPSMDFEESKLVFVFSSDFSFEAEAAIVALRTFGVNLVGFDIVVTYGDCDTVYL